MALGTTDPRRAAVLEAVRTATHADFRQPVDFVVRLLQMQSGYVLAELRPVGKDGAPLDLRRLATGWHGDGATLSVLLRRTAEGTWGVVAMQVGTQLDAWASRYHAPDTLFPPDD